MDRVDRNTGKKYDAKYNIPLDNNGCFLKIMTIDSKIYSIFNQNLGHADSAWYEDTFVGDYYAVFERCHGFNQQVSKWYAQYGYAIRQLKQIAEKSQTVQHILMLDNQGVYHVDENTGIVLMKNGEIAPEPVGEVLYLFRDTKVNTDLNMHNIRKYRRQMEIQVYDAGYMQSLVNQAKKSLKEKDIKTAAKCASLLSKALPEKRTREDLEEYRKYENQFTDEQKMMMTNYIRQARW